MNQDFIDRLSQIVYTEEGITLARYYLEARKIDPDQMRYPCTVTGANDSLFSEFSSLYPVSVFVDSLYIPIVDITDPKKLVGFDVKYLGISSFRTRFHKFKITPETFMLYFSKNIDIIGDGESVIITESFIDALSLEQLGYTVLSPLTALSNLKFCLFLHAISDRIFLMFDNDDTGRKATQKIMKNVSLDFDLQKCFKPIIYSGKDPNEILVSQGPDYLKLMLNSQIGG